MEEKRRSLVDSRYNTPKGGMTVITTRTSNGIRYWEERTFDGILLSITSKEIKNV